MIEVEPDGPGWVAVTFRVPAEAAAGAVAVVGEFNEWNRQQDVMTPAGDGSHTLTVRLTTGRRYRFRYLLDGDRWQNDWQADDYVPNEYGGDDSVLDLTTTGPRRDEVQAG